MKKLLAIFMFPFLWIGMFLFRVFVYDLLHTLLDVFLNLFVTPLSSLFLLITLPFILILDIPIALFITFSYALDSCKELFFDGV